MARERSRSPAGKGKSKSKGKVCGKMHVIIKPSRACFPKFFVSVKPRDKIHLVKMMIEGLIGVRIGSQTLTFNRTPLENTSTLSDHNVYHFSTLNLRWDAQGDDDLEAHEWPTTSGGESPPPSREVPSPPSLDA